MSQLDFPERDIKAYAESVDSTDLKEEGTYFFVNYFDEEMLIPEVKTVVFIGRNLTPGDSGQVYFQDILSYRSGVRLDSVAPDKPAAIYHGSEDEVGHVFEFERALDSLLGCLERRKRLL